MKHNPNNTDKSSESKPARKNIPSPKTQKGALFLNSGGASYGRGGRETNKIPRHLENRPRFR